MAEYRLRIKVKAGDEFAIDKLLEAEGKLDAISKAKDFPVPLGLGIVQYADLANDSGLIIWRIGRNA